MLTANASDHQLQTLRLYGALVEERKDWGGGLVLCCGEGCSASGVPAAVSIAGGATLAVDGDAGAVKAAMRRGELDFVVNTLDEALRALKNEIRVRRPLSVGLIAEVNAALCDMLERGVQPDLLLIGANQNAQAILQYESIRGLDAGGMALRSMVDADGEWLVRYRTVLKRTDRYEAYLSAANAAELRALDERVLAILSSGDLVRRRWVQCVPQYLSDARSGGRWVWLTEEELSQLGG
jgi:urocanate hydratase